MNNIKEIAVMVAEIALEHPIRNTGCRIVVSLIHEMEKRGLKGDWPHCAMAAV